MNKFNKIVSNCSKTKLRFFYRFQSLMIKREYENFVSSQVSDSDVLSLASQSLASVRTNGSQSSMQKCVPSHWYLCISMKDTLEFLQV